MPPNITNPVGRASSTGFTTAVASGMFMPLVVGQEGPAPSEDSASSDSVEALHILIPGGRASPPVVATAVTSALVVPLLDQEGPSSPGHTASLDSVVSFAIPRGRASPAGSAVPSALVVPLTLDQKAPASPEHAASSGSVETLCSAINSGRLNFTSRLCECCNAGAEFGCCQALCFAIPSSSYHSPSALCSPSLCFFLEAFCGEITRCTPPVAWRTDDGVMPLVRAELISPAGSCWLPTNTPLCHITWDARRRSALRSSCTSAESAHKPSRCTRASDSSEWPNRHAPTLCHRHIGPFQHGTQAGINIERDCAQTIAKRSAKRRLRRRLSLFLSFSLSLFLSFSLSLFLSFSLVIC